MSLWKTGLADKWDQLTEVVTIAMVGKYTELSDAYLSVTKALQHACLAANRKLRLEWVEASNLEPATKEEDPAAYSGRQRACGGLAACLAAGCASSPAPSFQRPLLPARRWPWPAVAWEKLRAADGVLVPGGFGGRGVEGKILAANYARTSDKPYLGICLGMQIAVIEFARNVLDMGDANSTEWDAATPHPVVVFMPEGARRAGGALPQEGRCAGEAGRRRGCPAADGKLLRPLRPHSHPPSPPPLPSPPSPRLDHAQGRDHAARGAQDPAGDCGLHRGKAVPDGAVRGRAAPPPV